MGNITFSGTGSGLPVSDWIESIIASERQPLDKIYTKKETIQKSKTALNGVESKISSLRSAIEKLTDGNIASAFDLFGRRTATSSNDAMVGATASNQAVAQQIKLKVESLATSTVAKSGSGTNVARFVNSSDLVKDLSNGQGTTGKSEFSIYVDGAKYSFQLTDESTLGDVVDSINTDLSSKGVVASIDDTTGNFKIDVDKNLVSEFKLGSSSDTSNFFNITQLSTAKAVNTTDADNGINSDSYTSINPLNAMKTSGKIMSDANLSQAVTNGTFTIGKATFTIDENTTFNDLISKINSNSKAGVTAQYDLRSNKLILTSKNPGSTSINLGNGDSDTATADSNFLSVMGLTTADNKIAAGTQTLGNNAKFYLNDSTTAIEANSNTVTSDITGLAGVTLNLKNITSQTTTSNGVTTTSDNPVTIDIKQDTDQLVNAVNDFITKFNDFSNLVNSSTASGGDLKSEYSLVSLKGNLRQMATGAVGGITTYNNLAAIGISTGAVSTSTSTASTNTLQLDKDKFLTALQKNPEEVKALLVGDKQKGITGVFQKLESKVETALDPINGYFAAREDSYNKTISDYDKSIERGEDKITARKAMLTQQFNQMDTIISKLKNQSSYLNF